MRVNALLVLFKIIHKKVENYGKYCKIDKVKKEDINNGI